jgi:hypothetical protein
MPAVVPPTPRGPHPWLAPILSVIAIGVAILWAYLQMRHWKDPDADYVSIAANIVVTIALWVILIAAIVATYRFRKVSPREERPVITPRMMGGFIVFAVLGLGAAWYLSHRSKPSSEIGGNAKVGVKQENAQGPPAPPSAAPVTAPKEINPPPRVTKKKSAFEAASQTKENPQSPTGSIATGPITTGNCGVIQVGGAGNQATGGNCAPAQRVLTDKEKATLIAVLRPYCPFDIAVRHIPGNEESQTYADQFSAAIREAGCMPRRPRFLIDEHNGTGIWIVVHDLKEIPPGAEGLATAMIQAGLKINTGPSDALEVGSVYLFIELSDSK